MSAAIHREHAELRLLFEVLRVFEPIGPGLPGLPDLASRLQQVLEVMLRHSAMTRGLLALTDQAGAAVQTSCGLGEAEKEKLRYRQGEGAVGRAVASGQAVLLPRGAEEPLFLNRSEARDFKKRDIAFICVPLVAGEEVLGAFCADCLFDSATALEEDLRLMRLLASLMARPLQTRLEFEATHNAALEENRRLRNLLHGAFKPEQMVGTSKAMRPVYEQLAQLADSDAAVLILGESGSGREMLARIIHAGSARSESPFMSVNCAALPEAQAENELFGLERDIFNGAVATRKGRLELAQGGTIFLDEVGALGAQAQARLLRVMQQREFERSGGNRTLHADLRILAATSRDLEEQIRRGEFRQDLYYRLSVFPINLPPLRKRKDDIMPLVTHFVEKNAGRGGRRISRITPAAVSLLMAYGWPGNIRELENVVERAAILAGESGVIDGRHLPPWLQRGSGGESAAPGAPPPALPGELSIRRGKTLDETLGEAERRLIEESLRENSGNMAKCARQLGVSERIMGLRMKKHGLEYKSFRKS